MAIITTSQGNFQKLLDIQKLSLDNAQTLRSLMESSGEKDTEFQKLSLDIWTKMSYSLDDLRSVVFSGDLKKVSKTDPLPPPTDEKEEEDNKRTDEQIRLLGVIADNTGGGGKDPVPVKQAAGAKDVKPTADTKESLVGGLTGGMKALGDTAKGLLGLAAALWITSKAMQEFADVSWGDMAKGLIVMGGLVLATKYVKSTDASNTLLALGASLLITAFAIEKFGDLDWGSMFKAGLAISALVIATQFIKASDAHKVLLALGAALLITAFAIEKFGDLEWGMLLKGGLVLGALVLAVSAIGAAGPLMLEGAAALLIMGGALLVTAAALTMFSDVEWGAILKATVALVALGGVAVLLGTVAPLLILGSIGILALGVGLLAASVGLKNFADLDWETIAKAGVGIAALGVIAAGLGVVSPLMLLAGIGLTALGVGLISVGAGLQVMADLKWETIAQAAVTIAALGVVSAGIGLLSPLMLLAGIGLTALGVGLISVGAGLQVMADLKWETIAQAVVAIGALVAVGALAGVLSPLLILGSVGIAALGLALIPFAAAMALAGPAFEQFADAMDKLSKIDGGNLLAVGAGLAAVAAGMVAFGAAQAIAGVGNLVGGFLSSVSGQKTPVEQMEEMSKYGDGLVSAGKGMNSISEGMAAFSNIKPETLKAVDDFPWMKATAFAAVGGVMKVSSGDQTVAIGKRSADNKDTEREIGSSSTSGGTNIVNAPTTINKSTQSLEYRMPIRNPESSVTRYLDSRYGIQA